MKLSKNIWLFSFLSKNNLVFYFSLISRFEFKDFATRTIEFRLGNMYTILFFLWIYFICTIWFFIMTLSFGSYSLFFLLSILSRWTSGDMELLMTLAARYVTLHPLILLLLFCCLPFCLKAWTLLLVLLLLLLLCCNICSMNRQWCLRERPLGKTLGVGLQGSEGSFQVKDAFERPVRSL